MNLDQQIASINNSQQFVELCNTVLTAKYGDDFQVIDGTRSDEGNDGYVRSEKRIFAIYCPIKPQNKTDKDFKDKIKNDIKKAKKLNASGKLEVKRWTFVTPSKISNEVFVYLTKMVQDCGFEGNHLESTFLGNILYEHPKLCDKFPCLQVPKIEQKLDELLKYAKEEPEGIKSFTTSTDKPFMSKDGHIVDPKTKRQSWSTDLKRVFEIMTTPQTETSKSELKSIYYKSTDKIAQVNAILGLIKWRNMLDDKPSEMLEWCEHGMCLAHHFKSHSLKAYFLAYKGNYLTDQFILLDMNTAFSIRAGNMFGVSVIPEEQRQNTIKRLRLLEEQASSSFTEALSIMKDDGDAYILPQVLLVIGQSAGLRYMHFHQFGIDEKAELAKALSKRALLGTKEIYSAIGDELGVGYALHNLANQLHQFQEIEEAKDLNKTSIEIANRYGDKSLLQTAIWLEETLRTGKIPNYAGGERRERKI